MPKQNKLSPFNTFLHYSDSDTKERTVFGVDGGRFGHTHLGYTYSDRLCCNEWSDGLEAAIEQGIPRDCARYFEIGLERVLGYPVDLQHVILGVNRNSGYSYLVFGFARVVATSETPAA